jgi:hypothetical protein
LLTTRLRERSLNLALIGGGALGGSQEAQMPKFGVVGLVLAAAAAIAIAAPPAEAAAQSPATEQATQSVEVTPQGTLVTKWRPFSPQEKAALNAGTIRPYSASGCSEDVCIAIYGDHYYVSEWDTTAYWGGGYLCTHSQWWMNGNVVRTGNGVCGGSGVFFSSWQPKRNFPQGWACNTWQSIPGRPCEYISY